MFPIWPREHSFKPGGECLYADGAQEEGCQETRDQFSTRMTLTEEKEETIEELSLREPRGVVIMKRRHWKKRRRKLQMKKRKKRQSRVLEGVLEVILLDE